MVRLRNFKHYFTACYVMGYRKNPFSWPRNTHSENSITIECLSTSNEVYNHIFFSENVLIFCDLYKLLETF